MGEEKELTENQKLLIDATFRLSALENLLIKKGILTVEQLQGEYNNIGDKLNEMLPSILEQQKNQE
jgi:hypothetical protein